MMRRAAGQPMQGTFTRKDLRWALDLDEGIDFSIYLLGAFEPQMRRCYTRLISPASVILDLGANIGAHTLPMARLTGPVGKVVAVEATEYAFSKLRTNIALNPELVPRVIPVHGMLVGPGGEDASLPELYSSWPLCKGSDVHPVHRGALKPLGAARAFTTDDLVATLGLPRVDWIKLDVDGMELSVLEGAQQTLMRFRPGVFMELAPDYFADTPGEIRASASALLDHRLSLLYSRSEGAASLEFSRA